MKSIRLNKQLRADIALNIRQAYVAENPAPVVISTSTFLKDACRKYHMANSNKTMADLVKANPVLEGQISTTSYVYITTPDDTVAFYSEDNVNERCNREFAMYDALPGHEFNFKDLDNMPKELKAIWKAYQKVRKDERPKRQAVTDYNSTISTYMSDVDNVLAGVNTTAQLLDVWEECEKFLPVGIVNPSKINLPAVNIKKLNSALGVK